MSLKDRNVKLRIISVHFPFNKRIDIWSYYSSSRPGMYSKLTSKVTGLFGATLGLPGAELRPFGKANYTNTKHNNYTLSIN